MHFQRLGIVFLLLQGLDVRAAPSGADFLLLEPNAGAAAVGGAYAARRGRPEGLRYNPAALAAIQGAAASLAHVSAPGDWAHDWAGLGLTLGGFSLGAEVLASSIKPFELYDSDGEVAAMAQAGSQNLMLAAAAPLGAWLSLGAGVRVFRSQLHIYESQGWAVDLGLQAGRTSWPLSFGLALQNLGRQGAYLAEADPLPLVLRGGLLAQAALDPKISLDSSMDVLAFEDSTRPLEIRVGLEAGFRRRLALRLGLQRAGAFQQLSYGGGVQWQGWGLDYAFLPGAELGASHMIQLHLGSGR